ncbi:transcription antitermination factor NusB [Patescibacteria group bacterium]|nr:transcription antitermination factor NusB [Patescibacteria group bacterium]MBU1501067.1 transcription antitermination factor NusB [Patescibacteria group bacterium]MBU2081060.1 transcription antitermination factor NusB [Patescibacteria group bacterium]MBU2124151.1 transcription antitermination factor NusB [Patescibacteria group bacterium]MBU2195007.1 transcription antitermination factor NusB [Patescibacteria group bacterium]
MANRHLARSVVLQTLFEWDTSNASKEEAEAALQRNVEEFGGDDTDKPFMELLLQGVLAKQPDLDLVLTKAAPDWPLDRIAPVDRNILRIGLYELLFSDRAQVPAKVAINEAIELAKVFGGDSSGRFVNGVLGAVYKELGEPGKDETGKKERVRREDLPLQQLGGAIVYAHHEGQYYLALVHDVFGHWTLSKGKIEEGENVEEGTVREIKEELGLEVTIRSKIGENEYIASHPEHGKMRKHVSYFLAESEYEDIKLEKKGGLDDARWFRLTDILDLNFYDDMLPIVTEAVQKLLDTARTRV